MAVSGNVVNPIGGFVGIVEIRTRIDLVPLD
jgi:hypothetical protein